MIHTVKGFGIVNKAEIDVFLEISCFFDDPDSLYFLKTSVETLSPMIVFSGGGLSKLMIKLSYHCI